ncbi:hypothetical protein [Sphingomonas lacusdianchii]|uniref:hypothetical protein n=1 Tax=Sphingomonas lacusdianchii TaxID=2917992 RepID=UPI001F57E1E5|nr:hypothetical protein [Sphingomonas sp. JXJ CY 53]
MLAATFILVLLPVLFFGAFLFGAWREGRHSPYSFGIGRVISNSFSAIGAAPAVFLIGSVVLNMPLSLLPPLFPGNTIVQWIGAGGVGLAWLLFWPFIQLFLTAIALDGLAGRPADLHAALTMAGRRFLPGLVLIVLMSIGLLAGFLMLVIPGIVLMLTWFVVLPVLANEGRGVFECFARSGELLNGMRWRLLLLLVIVAVLWSLFTGLAAGLAHSVAAQDGSWTKAAIDLVTSALAGMLQTTGTAAVYHEARTAKEGMGSHDLEAVFA